MDTLEQLLVDLCDNNEIRIPGARLLPMSLGAPATETEDNPLRGTVADADGKPVGVLFLASALSPDLVQQSVDRAADAKSILNTQLTTTVLEPDASGYWNSLSFAFWPWCTPLSQRRLVRYMHRTLLRPHILTWLQDVARTTQRDVNDETDASGFRDDLGHIADNDGFPEPMRASATSGINEMDSGEWQPKHILEHGDFWMGNILRPNDQGSANPYKLSVIDWAGSRVLGYPFVDLIRFGLSSRIPDKVLNRQVHLHCDLLGCTPPQAGFSVLAAMGYLGKNLGHFPHDRYLSLATKVYNATLHASLGES